jgi:hypothetical protein
MGSAGFTGSGGDHGTYASSGKGVLRGDAEGSGGEMSSSSGGSD